MKQDHGMIEGILFKIKGIVYQFNLLRKQGHKIKIKKHKKYPYKGYIRV